MGNTMGKTVLKYGLIAGAIIIVVSYGMQALMGDAEMGTMEIVGWTSMLLALSMVYLGVRTHRLDQEGQSIGFGSAFVVGLLISLVATLFWAGGWEVYLAINGDGFYQEYADHLVESLRSEGATQAEINAQMAESQEMVEMAKNPFFRFMFSSIEILPVGILVSLISAFIESRRESIAHP